MLKRGTVFDADWLVVRKHLRPEEWPAAARALGMDWPDAQQPPAQVEPPGPVVEPPDPQPPPPPPVVDPPSEVVYWRVVAVASEAVQTEPPPWWNEVEPATAADHRNDPAHRLPQVRPLIPVARWASFLKQTLAMPQEGPELDVKRVAQQMARQEAWTQLPRRAVRRWPRRVRVLAHLPEHLGPAGFDLSELARQTAALLPGRVEVVAGGAAGLSDAPSRSGEPWLVLADPYAAAGADPHAGILLDALQRQARAAGLAVLVSTTQGARMGPGGIGPSGLGTSVQQWQLADQQPLRRFGKRLGTTLPAAANDGRLPAGSDGGAVLRAALLGNSFVTVDLLRELRRCLQGHGHSVDQATEVAVWNHAEVVQRSTACALLADATQPATQVWATMTAACRNDVAALHWAHLRSPLLRAAYARRVQPLLDPASPMAEVLDAGLQEGEARMRRLARAMVDRDGAVKRQAAGYLAGVASRCPDFLSGPEQAQSGWLSAWALAVQEQLQTGGASVPAGVSPQSLAWLMDSPAEGAMALQVRTLRAGAGQSDGSIEWLLRPVTTGMPTIGGDLGQLPRTPYWSLSWGSTPALSDRRLLLALQAWGQGDEERWRSLLMYLHLNAAIPVKGSRAPQGSSVEQGSVEVSHTGDESLSALAAILANRTSTAHDLDRACFEWRAWVHRAVVPLTDALSLASALAPYWPEDLARDVQVSSLDVPTRTVHRSQEAPVALALSEAESCGWEVRAGGSKVRVAPFKRPSWAVSVTHEAGEWIAETEQGERLVWRAAGTRYALAGASTNAPWLLPHAAWWNVADELALATMPDRRIAQPTWAARHGVDEHGLWAEFDVPPRHGGGTSVTQRLRFIPPGEFWMGSPSSEPERGEDETLHRVLLTRGYWLADTACTQALWEAVMGYRPSYSGFDPGLPAEKVSWDDITERFLPALNARVPGLDLHLPTEAQWEYACRAGTSTPFSFGDQIDPSRVNYNGNHPYADGEQGEYRKQAVRVKSLLANPWGLYEMHGNVWEWCQDRSGAYDTAEALNPIGPQDEAERVLRGGSWINYARYCRSALRRAYGPDRPSPHFGFRLARGLPVAGRAEPGGRGAPELQVLPAEPAEVADAPLSDSRGLSKATPKASRPQTGKKAKR